MTQDDRAKPAGAHPVILQRSSYAEHLRITEILRKETVGGILLLVAAALAILWANSPFSASYFAIRDFEFGYEPWHLKLSVGAWASDGLLAVFFFLTGLELKREFVAGDLRRLSRAIVPVAAAFGADSVGADEHEVDSSHAPRATPDASSPKYGSAMSATSRAITTATASAPRGTSTGTRFAGPPSSSSGRGSRPRPGTVTAVPGRPAGSRVSP